MFLVPYIHTFFEILKSIGYRIIKCLFHVIEKLFCDSESRWYLDFKRHLIKRIQFTENGMKQD